MRKGILLLLFLSFLLTSCYNSKRTMFLKDPVDKLTDSVDVSLYEKKYPDADGVYLEYERNIQNYGNVVMTFMTFGYNSSVRSKILVLNPKNQMFNSFKLDNAGEKSLEKLYLKTTSPEGKVNLYYGKDLIREVNSEGLYNYRFVYPEIKKGTIIEEAYEKDFPVLPIISIPLENDIPVQMELPCEKLSFNFAFPKWFDLKVKKTSADKDLNYKFTNDEENNNRILSYTDKDIPEYVQEPFSPYFKETGKYLTFKVARIDMGSVKYNSAESWKEFASKFEDYAIDRDGFLFSDIVPLTADIVKGCKTDMGKLDSIVSYVQKNIEIDNSKGDISFRTLLREKKGNTLIVTGMTMSMLRKAGLKADYLLIHSADAGYFDENYVSSGQFSFPAVQVAVHDTNYVVFPYIKKLPVNVVPDFILDEKAMLIEGNSTFEFTKISSPGFSKNSVDDNINITINDDGKLTVEQVRTFKGFSAFNFRQELEEMKDKNRDDFIKSLLPYSGGEINIVNFEIKNRAEYARPLELHFKYTVDNLVTVTPEDILLQTSGMLSPVSLRNAKIDVEKRKNPVKIPFDENNTKNITINFPREWKVQTGPEDINIENCFGKLKSHTEVKDGVLKITQQNSLLKSFQPREKIKELAEIIGSYTKNAVATIVFQKKG